MIHLRQSVYLIIFLSTLLFAQSNYSLEDVNPNSPEFGSMVGPSYYEGKVVLHYFGSFTWGTCTTRFGELNEIYQSLKDQGQEVALIGVSKSSWSVGLGNWTSQGSASICIDESPYQVWDNWEASQRDLFITDQNGTIVYQQNITSGVPDDINDVILDYLQLEEVNLPTKVKLNQNYPNPFNPITKISYEMPSDGFVKVSIIDMMGREVKTLVESSQVSGMRSVTWNATDNNDQPVSAGVYLYKIQTRGITKTRKMVFLK